MEPGVEPSSRPIVSAISTTASARALYSLAESWVFLFTAGFLSSLTRPIESSVLVGSFLIPMLDLHDLNAIGCKDGELPRRDRDVVGIGRVRRGAEGEGRNVKDPRGGGEDDRVHAGSDHVLADLEALPVGDQRGRDSIGSVGRVGAPLADLDRDVDRDLQGPGEADLMEESLGVLDLSHFGAMSEDAGRLAEPDLTKDRLVISALDDRLEALRGETCGVGLHGGVLEEANLLNPFEEEERRAQALESPGTHRAQRGLAASPQLFVRLPVSAKDRVLEVGHALPPDHGRLNLRQR